MDPNFNSPEESFKRKMLKTQLNYFIHYSDYNQKKEHESDIKSLSEKLWKKLEDKQMDYSSIRKAVIDFLGGKELLSSFYRDINTRKVGLPR